MTWYLYRSIPILAKTRNLSSDTTCSPAPAAVAQRPHAVAAMWRDVFVTMWPWRLTFWRPGQCMPSNAICTVYGYQAWFLPSDALQCKAQSCYRMASLHPSVCPSVRDVGGSWPHIGWKSWKLIARTISPTSLLFIAHRSSTYSQGNM